VNYIEYANTYAGLVLHILRPVVNSAFQANPRTPCLFCKDPTNIHLTRISPVAQQYLKDNKISLVDGFWCWPSGARIQTHHGFCPASVINNSFFLSFFLKFCQCQQHLLQQQLIFIEEVQEESTVQDAYMVYQLILAVSKEKKPTPTPVSAATLTSLTHSEKKVPQFQYKSKVEDSPVAQKVFEIMMESPVTLSQGELPALAPDIQKLFVDGCKAN